MMRKAKSLNFTNKDAGEFIYNAPIYVNGQVILIDKFNIASLNATTGKMIWSFYTGDELYVGPTYANGKIYDVTSQRHIFILNANQNGSKLQTIDMPSSSWSAPIIANNMLYIGCNDWNLYAFNASQTSNSTSPFIFTPTSSGLLIATAISVAVFALAIHMTAKKKRKRAIQHQQRA